MGADRAIARGTRILSVLVPFGLALTLQAQPLLERRVSIQADGVRLSRALELLAKEGGFKLSYDAAAVPADSVVVLRAEEEVVGRVLRRLLPEGVRWSVSGSHLIITGEAGRKRPFSCAGTVVDAVGGMGIARVTVLDVRQGAVASTDAQGLFRITLSAEVERVPLRIARTGYRDTVVYVDRGGEAGRIRLQRLAGVERMDPICSFERCGVEDLGVARLLVSDERMEQAANLGLDRVRGIQLSVVPSVSTNGVVAASTVNRISVNLLGGYARGVQGVEVGGAVNLLSRDMKGLQVGGLANLVGGRTRGVQIGGAINHGLRSLEGLQLAGLANTVWDTLAGVQLAGGLNVVKRGMTGVQVSGAGNVALGDLDGVQVTGGVNVAHGQVNKAQVAGAVNYARGVRGGQVSAGVNVALGEVGGGQVGFIANYARQVSGGQFSFGANVAPGPVSGGQVGFALNYAHQVTRGQFSFGANVVPGRMEAAQVGFALNYAHQVARGQFSFGANIVPGRVGGGQVGALNLARTVGGAQVGFVNLSDSLGKGAVGLLTISLKGFHRVELVAGDVMPLSLLVRTGTRGFHNILGGSPPVTADRRWSVLYGIGTEARLGDRFVLDVDLTAEQVVEQEAWVDALNLVGRFGISPGVRFGERFHVGVGPVLNALVTTWRAPDSGDYRSALIPASPILREEHEDTLIGLWVGWKASAGVQF